MVLRTQIVTALKPDSPRILTGNYQLGLSDRQYIDQQILGVQRHVADSLIRGQIGTWFMAASDLAAGDVVCASGAEVNEQDGSEVVRTAILATPSALAAAGLALGVVLGAARAGSWVRVAVLGVLGKSTTGLAAGTSGLVRVSSAGRCERVAAHAVGDYPLGFVDGAGNLSMKCERAVVAAEGSGAGGFQTTVVTGFSQPAVNSNVTANVASTTGIAAGAEVFVENGGFYQVVSVADSTHVSLKNRGYPGNAAPSGSVTAGGKLTPAGLRGTDGAAGTAGAAGAAGTAGAAGVAATTTNASYVQPAVNSTVTVTFVTTAIFTAGSHVYIAGGGYYQIASVTDGTHAVVTNMGIIGNAVAGATVNTAARATPAGAIGAPYVDLVQGPDLIDADETLTVAQGGIRRQPAGSTTAGRTKALSVTGARARQVVRIDNLSSNTLTIKNASLAGATLTTIPPGAGSDFGFDGTSGAWIPGNNADVALTPGTPGPQGIQGVVGPQGLPGVGLFERKPRAAAYVMATANVNPASCPSSVDGTVIPGANYIVFLSAQTTPSENGLYVTTGVASGGFIPITKITDLDACRAAGYGGSGILIRVRFGTVASGSFWYLSSANAVSSAPATADNFADFDIDDFYVAADGNDFSPAWYRVIQAMRGSGTFGTVYARRLAVYTFATPLIVSVPVTVRSNGGRWAPYSAGGSILQFNKDGFVVCSGLTTSNALVPAAGARFFDLTLWGIGGTDDQYAIHHTCQIEIDNVEIQGWGGRGIYNYGSTGHDYDSINYGTTADFAQPAIGSNRQVQVASTALVTVGTLLTIATGGYYRVVSIDSSTLMTLRHLGPSSGTAYAAKAAALGVTVLSSSAIRGVFGNTDGSSVRGARIKTIGLSAVYTHGDNSNTCRFEQVSISVAGMRGVDGDHYGIYEGSFLGNTYDTCACEGVNYNRVIAGNPTTTASFVQPDSTGATSDIVTKTVTLTLSSTTGISAGDIIVVGASGWYYVTQVVDGTTLRVNCRVRVAGIGSTVTSGKVVALSSFSFYSIGAGNKSVWVNCYTESSNPANIGGASFMVGGRIANTGIAPQINIFSGGVTLSNPYLLTTGPYNVIRKFTQAGTDELENFSCDGDVNGYTFNWRSSTNYWQYIHAGTTSLTAAYFTGGNHGFGGGWFGVGRGLLLQGQRLSYVSGAGALPANSSAADQYLIGSVALNSNPGPGGPVGWRVTARTPNTNVGALTWAPLGYVPVSNVNLGFSATLAATTEETRTTTVTGAGVGDNVIVNPRGALPSGITIDHCRVSATSTVEIRIYNRTGSPVDCSTITWDIRVQQ